jgi:hypothetical protein
MAKSKLTKYATIRDVKLRYWTSDPLVTADIEIHMDLERITREVGARALHNKSGKARCLNGALVVKVNRKDE